MRVVLSIHHSLDRNAGAPGATLQLKSAYEMAGHDVVLASFDDLPRRIPQRAKVLAFPFYLLVRFGPSLLAGRYDVLDLSTGDGWLLSLFPRRLRRALLVCRSHGLEHVAQQARRRQMSTRNERATMKDRLLWWGFIAFTVSLTLRRADGALLLNEVDKDYAVSVIGCDQSRMAVVRNGVSTELLSAARLLPRRRDPRRICFVGSWREIKGVTDLPSFFAAVHEKEPGTRLVLLGTRRAEAEIRALFSDRCRPAVSVVEEFENASLPVLVADAGVLVVPSRSEGYGMAVVEGIACGLVPVCYDAPGPRSIVEASSVGVLVPDGEVGRLTEAVEELIERPPQELQELSLRGRAWAEGQAWPQVAAEQLELYAKWSGAPR